ncbi:hypothetical protein TNCV_3111661 [Trichonephila clavipes]|nr:hypothetical protein TNCV_3111661 [Trichonephila clavipes]
MTRSSAPYLETTILLGLLAWLVGGGVASLRQEPMRCLIGLLGLSIAIRCWKKGHKIIPFTKGRQRVNINVALFSYSRTFGNGPRNFEPWSSDEDNT